MAWQTNVELIQKLYIAFYGRPADPGGLRYWASQLPDNAAPDSPAVRDLIVRFINSDEARARVIANPTNLTDLLIDKIYSNAFGRNATATEKSSFSGKSVADVLISVASVQYGLDYANLNEKLAYAKWFTNYLDPNGDGIPNDDATGTKFAATYSGIADADRIAAKIYLVDASNPAVQSKVLDDVRSIADTGDYILTTPPVTGQVFTLTDKTDNITNVGSGIVKGVISSVSGETTWGVADTISGGIAGSQFDLTVVLGGNLSTAGRSVSGVESYNITLADADPTASHTFTVDASTLSGAKNFTIVGATASTNDKIAFTQLTKDQVVTIKSTDADLDVDFSFKTGEDAGPNDTATIYLNGGKVDTITVNGTFETLKVDGTGTSSVRKLDASGNAMTNLIITGAGKTTLSNVTGWSTSASALTIDASAATGDVTVGTDISSKFTVKGGSGNDTLIATNTTSTTISSAFKAQGIETILFLENGTGSALSHSIDLTNATGVTTVGLRGSAATNADSVTFNNITDKSTILLQGSKTAANQYIGNVTVNVKGATSSAPADSLTINVNNQGMDVGVTGTTENTISVGTVTANNVKNITINAADGDVSGFTLSANGLVSLTVKASEDFVFSSTVGNAGTTTTIDASQVTGKASFKLVSDLAKDVTVTTGAGNDNVELNDQDANSIHTITINTGDGNDTFTTGALNSVNQKTSLSVNLGAGDDTVVVTNGKNMLAPSSGIVVIDFGDGTADTLKFAGSSSTDISGVTLNNLEKVILTGTEDLTVQAASFSGTKIEIMTFNTGLLNLKGTDSADTIDASTLTIVGPKGVKITGGKGDDTIKLSNGQDTVIFEDTGPNNGKDIIFGFTQGSSGDKLDFTAFLGGSPLGLLSVRTSNPEEPTPIDGKVARLVDIPDNQDITTATGLEAALRPGGEYANIVMNNNTKAIIITAASDNAGVDQYVFFASSNNQGTISVDLVGVIKACDIDEFVIANFA